MAHGEAYIIGARRTALGRVGGLHARRRIEDLTAPVVRAVLGDCKLNPALVDSFILGNATEMSNPARLISLASGLPEAASAITLDRQCASGLDAIVQACRSVGAGEADVIVAGGAESLSTAPWRVARPRHMHQLPRFLGFEPSTADAADEPQQFEASERLARESGIGRDEQDAVALRSHVAAMTARDARRFVGEIVPLRSAPEEARDEMVREMAMEELAREAPYMGQGGLLTASNTSALADGAAIALVISPRIWDELGRPRALRLVTACTAGVAPDREAFAAIAATQRLRGLHNDLDIAKIAAIETSETSAAQLIVLARHLGLDPAAINAGGGAIARGHPFAAAGAVLVVRLFSTLVRAAGPRTESGADNGALGLATLSAFGGLGAAALFQAA
jgi:acetyl-CoA C-acetyltransferase